MQFLGKIALLASIVLMTSCQDSEKTDSDHETLEATSALEGSSESKESPPETELHIPAVVLRDEAVVWDSRDEKSISGSLHQLDMGTEITYLGIDKELTSGSNSYDYSRVELSDGTSGWVSTFRLAKNAISAVVVEKAWLYKKTMITTPVNRTVPGGQIVAVSLEQGQKNGFAQITFSWYDGDRISNPETLYIEYDKLSVNVNDIGAAQLTLKAFRYPEQRSDFFNLAISTGSIFNVNINLGSERRIHTEPDINSDRIEGWTEMRVLAVNPWDEGDATDWYPVIHDDENPGWIQTEILTLDAPLRETISLRPPLDDKSTYTGEGVPSINLYQGLSYRKLVKDEQGDERLIPHKYLEIGEIVYTTGREMKYDNIDFIHIEFPGGDNGWSSKSYIITNSRAAVITENNIRTFKEPKLTALSKLKLDRFQIAAVSNEEFSGFIKLSYIDRKDKTLHKDVYVQLEKAAFSYNENDVNTALLLEKISSEENEESREIYTRKIMTIPSIFQNDLNDILTPIQSKD